MKWNSQRHDAVVESLAPTGSSRRDNDLELSKQVAVAAAAKGMSHVLNNQKRNTEQAHLAATRPVARYECSCGRKVRERR